MKAVIRSDKGVFELALLSDDYYDAMYEIIKMEEEGIIKADEEIISIKK